MEPLEGFTVALEQHGAQREKFDLLGTLGSRDQRLQILRPAFFEHSGSIQPECFSTKAGLGDKRWDCRAEKNQHGPWTPREQDEHIAGERQRGFDKAQDLANHIEWSGTGFAPCLRESVVEVGVFEIVVSDMNGLLENRSIDGQRQGRAELDLCHLIELGDA